MRVSEASYVVQNVLNIGYTALEVFGIYRQRAVANEKVCSVALGVICALNFTHRILDEERLTPPSDDFFYFFESARMLIVAASVMQGLRRAR